MLPSSGNLPFPDGHRRPSPVVGSQSGVGSNVGSVGVAGETGESNDSGGMARTSRSTVFWDAPTTGAIARVDMPCSDRSVRPYDAYMLETIRALAPWVAPLASVAITLLRIRAESTPVKRLGKQVGILTEALERLPEAERTQLAGEVAEHLKDYSAELRYERSRRLDWATVATIGIVNALGAGVLFAAYFIGGAIAWTIAGLIAALLFLFSIAGITQLHTDDLEDHQKPVRLRGTH